MVTLIVVNSNKLPSAARADFARQNIQTIPDSLRESARMDGAGEWKIFFRIILPLSKPVAATLGKLKFVGEWNSLLWPMIVLRSEEKRLISNAIAFFNEMQMKTYYAPRMALTLVCAIPLLLLYLILQKYIVQSVALSGVKQWCLQAMGKQYLQEYFREEPYIPEIRLYPEDVDGVEGINATHSCHKSIYYVFTNGDFIFDKYGNKQ